ncbi:protein of unknown function [Legionella micdadei]|uniref:Uncharacterized protein n=1 Tax=Legionella micdadei TaxID=451 RepID=A0A098GET7_LEGMI|nr:protein of unknown function [Legionella micdadei]
MLKESQPSVSTIADFCAALFICHGHIPSLYSLIKLYDFFSKPLLYTSYFSF